MNNKPVVTYIFGAGASVGAMPLARDMPTDIENFLSENRNNIFPNSQFNGKGKTNEQIWIDFEARTKALLIAIKENDCLTVDDYLELMHSNNQSIEVQKAIISTYIFWKQLVSKKKFDPRYRRFFQKIVRGKQLSKEHQVNILTWNYDSQIQFALRAISPELGASKIHDFLNIYPPIDDFGTNKGKFESKHINTFYLNGYAGFHHFFQHKQDVSFLDQIFFQGINGDSIARILNFYDRMVLLKDMKPLLFLAWETESYLNQIQPDIDSSIAETDTLILIGYSIPDTNRKIDFHNLTKMVNLKEIFVQEKHDDTFTRIKFTLNEVLPKIIVKRVPYIDEFYIPNDLLI